MTDSRPTPWSISYADGSANVYRFAQQAPDEEVVFEYAPMTPERSSSGSYSGGDPRQERMPSGDPRVEELWRRVERLGGDRSLHAASRMMGTGQFRVTTASGTRVFIIDEGAELTELEGFLDQFGQR